MPKPEKKLTIQHIHQNDGVLTCNLDLSLIDLPFIQKMLVLENVRASYLLWGSYFKFDDATQAYWDENQSEYQKQLREEDYKFAQFREMMLSQAVGPLYECVQEQMEIVTALYRYKAGFERASDERIPSVMYRVGISSGERVLSILNLDDFNHLSKKLRLDWIGNFLMMLDYHHAKLMNESVRRLHSSGTKVRHFVYPGDNVPFEGISKFVGDEAILTILLHSGLEKFKHPEQILRMMTWLEQSIAYKKTKPVTA